MDTSKLKTFAQAARRVLREQVEAKLKQVLDPASSARRESPAAVERLEAHVKESGRESVIDAVAYTWFNRFCALRYMDARGYTRVRIVSPSEGFTQPEILAEAKSGQFDDQLTPETVQARVLALLNGTAPSTNPQSEAYRILLVAACNSYRKILPSIFEHIADEIELLMPDDLLAAGSVLSSTVETLTEDDCKDVEILGWLYQFYISERKDQVMARKSAVPTEDIPAVTQLFTPHWIVRYLVENSLGRLWLLNRPGSRLREHMPYYIEDSPRSLDIPVRASSSSEGQGTDKNVHPTESQTDFLKITKPEEIRLCDPAVGSGHMLTYAFDLLTLIYEEEGYAPTEIPALILRHNLHGLEICPRAAQLAELALVFKAREKSRRFFQPEHFVRPNIIELQNVSFADGELEDYLRTMGIPARRGTSEEGDGQECPSYGKLVQLMQQFEEAKNFGSLIQPCLSESEIQAARSALHTSYFSLHPSEGQLFLRETHLKVLRVLEQAEALTQRYHVVVANPPYMGNRASNSTIKAFASANYEASKMDLFAMFIERAHSLSMQSGFISMVTMHGWMFLTIYADLRELLLSRTRIENLAHLGPNSFDSIGGEVVQTVAFVLQNAPPVQDAKAVFIRAVAGDCESAKDTLLRSGTNRFQMPQRLFQRLPGKALMFWLPSKMLAAFDNPSVRTKTVGEGKNVTSDNARFVRFHWEVCGHHVGRNSKWLIYAKGGPFRKWWGNLHHVVDWSPETRVYYRQNQVARIIPEDLWYRVGVTWTDITTTGLGFRLLPEDTTFDASGLTVFPVDDKTLWLLLGLLNSVFSATVLPVLNPSLHVQLIDVKALPLPSQEVAGDAEAIATQAVTVARADWDNFETSWDFRDQPLLRPGLKGATLEASWRNWEAQSTAAIRRMQELETENNRLFIAAYGLDGELQPEVPEAQITLARAEARRDMAAFLSYAVGCMMGRYSLDAPGLILADAGATVEDYLKKVSSFRSLDILVRDSSTMKEEATDRNVHPTEDNVIPILDGDWFPDDITERFKKFLKVTFGEEHFDENMRFLEESLGKDVRKYFLTDFYKNHVQTYKKRPIYWLFSSPKGTFNALIYMHRYRPDTVSVVLKYLRDFQTKLQAHKQHLQSIADSADAKKADKTKALKEITQLTKDLKELEDYERKVIYPLASERREIDLDDGVKHNYPLFGDALKKIPGLDAKEEE